MRFRLIAEQRFIELIFAMAVYFGSTPLLEARITVSSQAPSRPQTSTLTSGGCARQFIRIGEAARYVSPRINLASGRADLHELEPIIGHTRNIESAIMELWELSASLETKLFKIDQQSPRSPIQLRMARHAQHSLRELRIILRWLQYQIKPQAPFDILADPDLHMGPHFDPQDFQSGDIILSRGPSLISSAIANIGVEREVEWVNAQGVSESFEVSDDGHFSHAFMVYRDPKTNELWAIESEETRGVRVTPLLPYLRANSNGAWAFMGIFRYRDRQIAEKAAQMAFEEISANSKAPHSGTKFFYNFQPQCTDSAYLNNHMNCIGVPVRWFPLAAKSLGKDMKFPDPRAVSIVGQIPKRVANAFRLEPGKPMITPSDAELDPMLDLVGEWIHPTQGLRALRADMVLDQVFATASTQDSIPQTRIGGMVGSLGHINQFAQTYRILSLLRPLLAARMAPNTPPEIIRLVADTYMFLKPELARLVRQDQHRFHTAGSIYRNVYLAPQVQTEIENRIDEYFPMP